MPNLNKIRKYIVIQMKGTGMKYLLFTVLLLVVLITAGCVSGDKNSVSPPARTTPTPRETVTIIPTTIFIMNQNIKTESHGVAEFKEPEKITKPEDLQAGDFIQMPMDDTYYEKNHGYVILNISLQDNLYFLEEIEKDENTGHWFRNDNDGSRLISFEVLLRDYPYKFGHSSGPLSYCYPLSLRREGEYGFATDEHLLYVCCLTYIEPEKSIIKQEIEILHDKGTLTTKTFRTYNMGIKNQREGFKITLKAEQPVLGFALNTEHVFQLGSSDQIPHYESYSKHIQWGKLETCYVLEKAINSTTGELTTWCYPPNIPLTYVVDGRWMSFDPAYDNVQDFPYEITISKITYQ
jgi:hypothetical protein